MGITSKHNGAYLEHSNRCTAIRSIRYPSDYQWIEGVPMRLEVESAVLVTLLSDNFTEVVLSNIGRLGNFQSKVLSLRPGEYTIRGSARGCRDIFLTVTVLPGIAPIEVFCMETIR